MKYLLFLFLMFVGLFCFGQIPAQIFFNENANRLPILNGMSLWLDAADAGSIVKDVNNKVRLWQDKSGNANHAYQETTNNQPIYTVNQQNGLATVVFSSNAVTMASATDGTGLGDYQTIIAVRNTVNTTEGNSYQTLFASGANEDFSLRYNGRYNGSGNYSGDNNGNDWANGNLTSIYVNGVRTETVPARPNYHIVVAATTDANRRINRRYSLSTTFSNRGMVGGIAEIIIYDRQLTAAERQSIEAYLARKWRINISPAITIP